MFVKFVEPIYNAPLLESDVANTDEVTRGVSRSLWNDANQWNSRDL